MKINRQSGKINKYIEKYNNILIILLARLISNDRKANWTRKKSHGERGPDFKLYRLAFLTNDK